MQCAKIVEESVTRDLFDPDHEHRVPLGREAWLLRGQALPRVPELLTALEAVLQQAPARHLVTPGGHRMSVALSNCGPWGWISDRHGYRYTRQDPDTGRDWPSMPEVFLQLAQNAAARAGFADYTPDACLINRYAPGSRLTLHQDRNEKNTTAPIVSVSLGIPATFLFGGFERSAKCARIAVLHGDVVVWGGSDRMRFHGVLPIPDAVHPLLGRQRINFTFRRV